MPSITLTGQIVSVSEAKAVTEKMTKRTVVIEHFDETDRDRRYPNLFQAEAINDKTDLLDDFGAGQTVTLHCNLNGREWTNPQGEAKYFTSLRLWRIEAGAGAPAAAQQPAPWSGPADASAAPKAAPKPAPQPVHTPEVRNEDTSDLPF